MAGLRISGKRYFRKIVHELSGGIAEGKLESSLSGSVDSSWMGNSSSSFWVTQKSGTKAMPRPILARSRSRSLELSSISGTRSSWCCWNMEWTNSLVVLFRPSIRMGYSRSSFKESVFCSSSP